MFWFYQHPEYPIMAARIVRMLRRRINPYLRFELTTRETEILCAVAEGKRSKHIAVELDVSVKTVETHRSNIMKKLGLHSLGEIIRYAIAQRLVPVCMLLFV